jgi:hypothetical protein
VKGDHWFGRGRIVGWGMGKRDRWFGDGVFGERPYRFWGWSFWGEARSFLGVFGEKREHGLGDGRRDHWEGERDTVLGMRRLYRASSQP